MQLTTGLLQVDTCPTILISMEDPDVSIIFSLPRGQFASRKCLKVHLSNQFNRKKLPRCHEKQMDLVWEERCKQNPKLWNGTKFRLNSICFDDLKKNVVFNLGVTSYKEFICTNWSPNVKLFKELGNSDHSNSQIYLSDALGVGSLVHTADDFMILLRRSAHCGEAVGMWDIPGGHPEPQELVGKAKIEEIQVESLSECAVVDEIFNSTLREICDEVNLPNNTLTDPVLMGVARNTTSAGRPSSEYYVRCNLTSKEIQQLYNKGVHAEAEESTSIMFIPISDLPKLRAEAIWSQIAPSAKGCVLLYCQ